MSSIWNRIVESNDNYIKTIYLDAGEADIKLILAVYESGISNISKLPQERKIIELNYLLKDINERLLSHKKLNIDRNLASAIYRRRLTICEKIPSMIISQINALKYTNEKSDIKFTPREINTKID